MSAADELPQLPPGLVDRLRATLPDASDRPPVGPTRRKRLRANRDRGALLRELLHVANDLAEADLRSIGERTAVVDQLRALARRIEEGTP